MNVSNNKKNNDSNGIMGNVAASVTFQVVIKNCMARMDLKTVEDCSIQVINVCLSKLSLICDSSINVKLFTSNLDALELN